MHFYKKNVVTFVTPFKNQSECWKNHLIFFRTFSQKSGCFFLSVIYAFSLLGTDMM